MDENPSLLNEIKSKYILQNILSLAYIDIKSVFKLIKYNKSLSNKLDLDFKQIINNTDYKYEKLITLNCRQKYENNKDFFYSLIARIAIFVPFFIYIILYYVKGKLNEQTLKEDYNTKKKDFVDVMDKYILPVYLAYIILLIGLFILYTCIKSLLLRGLHKRIIFSIITLIDLTHYVSFIIQFVFTKKIINRGKMKETNEEIQKEYQNTGKQTIKDIFWFYKLDIVIIIFYSLYLCQFILLFLLVFLGKGDDECKLVLKQIKGVNIIDYDLPSEFLGFSTQLKNEFVFNKENMKKYEYRLNYDQIELIKKINNIRVEHKISRLMDNNNYNNCINLPDFILNEKTELIFNPNENIYKLSPNLYIFKYPKNEFQKVLNNEDVLNIITNESLNRICVIERKDIEYISIYNTSPNDIPRPKIDIDIRAPSPVDLNITEAQFDPNNASSMILNN